MLVRLGRLRPLGLAIAAIAVLAIACGGDPVDLSSIGRSVDPVIPPTAVAETTSGPVEGVLSGYVLPGGGSDGPWLPGSALAMAVRARSDERLTIRLTRGSIARWNALVAPAAVARPAAAPLAGAERVDPGVTAITIPAPPPGSWVVAVTIGYAGGGSGTYYWRVEAG